MMTQRRTLPPLASVAEVEDAMKVLIWRAQHMGELYRQAEEIAYSGGTGDKTRASDVSDPTLAGMMGGLTNADDDESKDQWAESRITLRNAVEAGASALTQLAMMESRLRSIIRANERRGLAGRSKTWTASEAERVADEYDRRGRRR